MHTNESPHLKSLIAMGSTRLEPEVVLGCSHSLLAFQTKLLPLEAAAHGEGEVLEIRQ